MGELVRPTSPNWSDFHARRDMSLAAWEQGTQESAAFVRRHMRSAKQYWDPLVMLRDMVDLATLPGLFLEFGVATGTTTRVIAAGTREEVHGFDSFQGLPEDWGMVLPKGAFGQEPPAGLPGNVRLVAGWFEDTLPGFVREHPGPVSFLHVDSDLYSSAKTIFKHLGERIGPGSIIVFDDYLNFPDWQDHEFKAFTEFLQYSRLSFEYLGVVMNGYQAAVRIL
jgi:predicted O-methyltransferase YrrM